MHNACHCLDSERGNLKQFKDIKRIKVGFIDENPIYLNFEHQHFNQIDQKGQKGQLPTFCTFVWSRGGGISKVSLFLVHSMCLRLAVCV